MVAAHVCAILAPERLILSSLIVVSLKVLPYSSVCIEHKQGMIWWIHHIHYLHHRGCGQLQRSIGARLHIKRNKPESEGLTRLSCKRMWTGRNQAQERSIRERACRRSMELQG